MILIRVFFSRIASICFSDCFFPYPQTNALASNQRRKIKGYGDFKRIAVIIIPDDDMYKERTEKQAAVEKSTVTENALTEMKGG